MYKFNYYHQYSLDDFDQPMGLTMNPDNRWVKKAAIIPWDEIEICYAELFPSTTGMPAKPLRAALGSLLIQKQYGYSDRELVDQITENPYYQYFIGLPGYTMEPPFVPSLMVEFRKRLNDDILAEINEMIIEYNKPDDPNSGENDPGEDKSNNSNDANPPKEPEVSENKGTIIIDATCAPSHIAYPQDINLLNEARLDLEKMIDTICEKNHTAKPRTYRRNARTDYLNFAKCKKRTRNKTKNAIRQQLQYVRRDLKYLSKLMETYGELPKQQMSRLKTIQKVYEQQKYMYDNETHSVPDRIVSLSQPYIRPIVRGKVAKPVEFGAKMDLSLDEDGMARIEKLSYDAYNEGDVFISAVEHYHDRTGHYPERVLVDQIYRNRKNYRYCKEHGIRLSGLKENDKAEKKLSYQDYVDRIRIERAFSLAKRKYGLGLIMTKLDTTTRSSIALSVLAMNVARIQATFLRSFLKLTVVQMIQERLKEYFGHLHIGTIKNLSMYDGLPPLSEYCQNKRCGFLVPC